MQQQRQQARAEALGRLQDPDEDPEPEPDVCALLPATNSKVTRHANAEVLAPCDIAFIWRRWNANTTKERLSVAGVGLPRVIDARHDGEQNVRTSHRSSYRYLIIR